MSILKDALKKCMNLIPMSNTVLLESNPDMADNTYSLFEKMIEKGFNDKYKFVWLVANPSNFKDVNIKNVYFKKWKPDTFFEKFGKVWRLYTAKYIIVCNKYIEKRRDKQVVAALGHGTILKSVKQYDMIGKDCDFTLCPSEFFVPIYCDQLKLTEKQMFISGYPRNDLLFMQSDKLAKVLGSMRKRCIIWMPTFRKQKNSGRVDSDFEFPLGIPVIYSEEELEKVNEKLKEKDMILALKLHPAQDTSVITAKSLSNVLLLTDDMLAKAGVKLYEILNETSALITDYSSIYYDYLLLDKPIGITLDDFNEYSKKNGFPFENVLDILKGHHMYNVDDLMKFIDDVAVGTDIYKEDRRSITDLTNKFKDGDYAQYVIDKLVSDYGF